MQQCEISQLTMCATSQVGGTCENSVSLEINRAEVTSPAVRGGQKMLFMSQRVIGASRGCLMFGVKVFQLTKTTCSSAGCHKDTLQSFILRQQTHSHMTRLGPAIATPTCRWTDFWFTMKPTDFLWQHFQSCRTNIIMEKNC